MSFVAGVNAGANLRDQRERLRTQAEQRNQELLKQGYSFDNGEMQVRDNSAAQAEQLQAAQAAQLAKSLQGKLAAAETDKALEDYALTGDASLMQRTLENDPVLKQAWAQKGVQVISNLDYDNDTRLLNAAGVKPTAYDTPEKRAIVNKNMYKFYNGKDWQLGLLNNAVQQTGALSRLGPRRGKPLLDNTKEFRDLLNGPKSSAYTADGHKYEQEIRAASAETGIPEDLLASMMAVESSGRKDVVSPKGATGLMQLMEDAAAEVGVTNRNDPAQNIMGGAKYLKKQLDAFGGDVKLALAAYNAGPGNVRKYGGVPPFEETENYVSKLAGSIPIGPGQDYVKQVTTNLDKGQKYYDRTADIIFDHMRSIANASAGKTNEIVDNEDRRAQANLQVDIAQLGQKDKELNQKDRALTQEDRSMDQKDVDQQLELRKQNIEATVGNMTTSQKETVAARDEVMTMLDEFGGEGQFWNADFTDSKNYNKVFDNINAIERYTNTQLSEADKKEMSNIRQLISLGDPAKELTSSQTGLLDAPLSTMEKYFSDNVKGVEAKAAYATFRNTLRNALYGSALTQAEIDSFQEAFGNLGSQLGPVLAQFSTSLEQVKSRLLSAQQNTNPWSAKVRMGADAEQIDKIIGAIDKRIEYLNAGIDGRPGGETGKQAVIEAFEG